MKTQAAPNPALAGLQPLIGRWAVEIVWSDETHKLVGGPSRIKGVAGFEWCDGGRFLRHTIGAGDAPPAHWMIGRDENSGEFTALYADSRGVSRVYTMSLAGDVWKIWRSAPGFHQRFAGRIGSDQRSIVAQWEKSANGADWQVDFDLTFTKTDDEHHA
jgi:hypothetical protein